MNWKIPNEGVTCMSFSLFDTLWELYQNITVGGYIFTIFNTYSIHVQTKDAN